jgi:hypothetical protein
MMKVPRGFARLGLLVVALAAASSACSRNNPDMLLGSGGSGGSCTDMKTSSGHTGATTTGATTTGATTTGGATTGGATTGAGMGGAGGSMTLPDSPALDARILDYNEALRTASLKLVGNLPTLQQTLDLKAAASPATAYATLITGLLADPRFATRMIAYFQNTMRQGNTAAVMTPDRDAAPTFAAQLVVQGTNFTTLFTATTGTCPTYDATTGMFTPANCANGPITAGILTDAGIHFQYYSNLAMRRDRFFQEVFSCSPDPSALSAMPVMEGMPTPGEYTSPFPWGDIAGMEDPNNGGRIDFHDTSSVVCANCHAQKNHRAPLFANFDANGAYQSTIQVLIPIACPTGQTCPQGIPNAQSTDWLPMGESTAWKWGQNVADIGALGTAMAADPTVQYCAVARMWNYVMSKGDIVNDAADLPEAVIAEYIAQFSSNGYNLRDVLQSMLVGPDFVRF